MNTIGKHEALVLVYMSMRPKCLCFKRGREGGRERERERERVRERERERERETERRLRKD